MTPGTPLVDRFELAVIGDRIVGYAAPAAGPLPCLLRLEADGEPIALAYASGWSAQAAAGIRLGWCGVDVPCARLAAALADEAHLYCHASGRRLAVLPVAITPAEPAMPVSVEAIIARERTRGACADVDQILPFARHAFRRAGYAGLLLGTYRSLLRRDPEPDLAETWRANPPPDPPRALLERIVGSAEFTDAGRVIPGPFHPDFAFDPAPMDADPA